MMLIICSDKAEDSVKYLIDHTNKRFVWKQMLELCQLLATCGITERMKPLKQGKRICEWIKRDINIDFIYIYYCRLLGYCRFNIKMLPDTYFKLLGIREDLWREVQTSRKPYLPIKTAIFRYKKGYKCEYESNSELPIDVVVNEYKKYIEWKEKDYANRITNKKTPAARRC